MKLILSTSAKVNYVFPGLTLYESVRLTAVGKRFPHIGSLEEAEMYAKKLKLPKNKIVFAATSNQAIETAQVIGKSLGKNVILDKRLLPLRFDIESIINKKEFNELGDRAFDVLRSRFLEAFFEDRLIDKQAVLKSKYRGFVRDITFRYSDKTVIAVSHSYLIQLFFIYNKVGERMFKERELLRKLFNPSKPLGFLKTVELEIGYN